MKDKIYINEELKDMFKKMGCGIVDYIEIYKVENDKAYFTAGIGKFHLTLKELEEYSLA